jgi:phospholipid transport system substrate-binding protein
LRLVAAGGVLAGLGVSGTARASEQGVDAPLSQLYSALEALMREGRATPFRQRFYRVAPVIDRAFDLDSILRGSVGTVWLSLDPSSQTALLNAFRRFTIASYVVNFDRYDGERFEVLAGQRAVGSDQVVQTRIVQGDGEPIRLDYVMRDSQAGWRAVDVLMDGTISRVAVQRSDFRALIRRGDASALIASLQRKTVDLAGSNSFDS